MYTLGLRCVNCRTMFPLHSQFFVCARCGVERVKEISVIRGITEVEYDYDALAMCVSKEQSAKRQFGLWRYKHSQDSLVCVVTGH